MNIDDIKNVVARANNLEDALNNMHTFCTQNNQKYGEVDLFRGMSEYFNKKSNINVSSSTTHQHYVTYNYNGKIIKCEISDLLIISYSKQKSCIKLTFLQAKYAAKRPNGLYKSKLRFLATKNQHILLTQLPKINNTIEFPDNILSDAVLPSITSYGVFFHNPNKQNKLSFAFEIAKCVKGRIGKSKRFVASFCNDSFCCCSIPDIPYIPYMRFRKCKWHYQYWWCHRHNNFCKDCISKHPHSCVQLCGSIDTQIFECFLNHFSVGSPIDKRDTSVVKYLIDVLSSLEGIDLLDDFISFCKESYGYNEPLNGERNNRHKIIAPSYVMLVKSEYPEDIERG